MFLAIVSIVMSTAPALATDLTGIVIDAKGDPVEDITVRLATGEMYSIGSIILSETPSDGRGQVLPVGFASGPFGFSMSMPLSGAPEGIIG